MFQPNTIKDELVPFIYRSNDKIDNVNLDNSLFSNIKVEFKDTFHCESSYNEVYQKIKNFYDTSLTTEFEDYKVIIPSLDKKVITDRYIDSLIQRKSCTALFYVDIFLLVVKLFKMI